jgi:hypothetical protein
MFSRISLIEMVATDTSANFLASRLLSAAMVTHLKGRDVAGVPCLDSENVTSLSAERATL